jgi:predicted ATPase
MPDARRDQNGKFESSINQHHRMFRFLFQAITRSDVIGPFRTPPERRYPFGGFSSSRGGPRGEQAVNLLITEALLNPHSARPLHNALSFWLKHLRLADSLDIRDLAKRLNLFEVDVSGAGRGTTANLADVGFGVSQVLPVLVQGLLMRRGGIYLVQQPEIHLHPDAQAGLADFFIYLASYGVITIIETHSEYLLLRLRRRLAEGIKPVSADLQVERTGVPAMTTSDVAVLFTGEDHGKPNVSQLEIGPSFQFENLPLGFMSQALDDRG